MYPQLTTYCSVHSQLNITKRVPTVKQQTGACTQLHVLTLEHGKTKLRIHNNGPKHKPQLNKPKACIHMYPQVINRPKRVLPGKQQTEVCTHMNSQFNKRQKHVPTVKIFFLKPRPKRACTHSL